MQLIQNRKQVTTRLRLWLDRYAQSVARLPRWRQLLIGYLVGLLLVSVALGIGLLEMQFLSPLSFPGLPLLFAVVLVAFFWGTGPAVFSILLSLLVLDYLYVPPLGRISGYGWDGMLQLFTFAVAGIVIALMASQREKARLRALTAEHEATLRAEQLEATFDSISDGVVVYNQRGEILQTNAGAQALFGLSALPPRGEAKRRQELLRQAAQSDHMGRLLSEKRQPLFRLLKGERLTGAKASDVLVSTPDGRKVMMNVSGAPIRGNGGNVERAVMIYRDVTQRRQLEQRTEESLQALLTTAQTLVQFVEPSQEKNEADTNSLVPEQVGISVVELTARIVESKHAVLLSVTAKDDVESIALVASTGLTSAQEQQWRDRLVHTPYLVDAIGSEPLVSCLKDDEVVLLDGMSLPLYTHVLPYYVQTVLVTPIRIDGQLVGLLCVDDGSRERVYSAQEMTLVQTIARMISFLLGRTYLQREYAEVRANEIALREANQHMEDFLNLVCHELKTPLTVIRGSLNLAERKVKRLISTEATVSDEVRRFSPVLALLERANNAVSVQDRLVNDLLDVARIQRQNLKLFLRLCNLSSIVQEAVEDQQQISEGRTIELELPNKGEFFVRADPDRLVQVVTNLLTNALKYSPVDRPVTVSISVDHREARVAVRDEGVGIPVEEHERVWHCFYRVPGIEAEGGSGAGLGVGLHLCRTLIEQHNGQIGVESSPGQGSTFWFILPLACPVYEDNAEVV